VALGYLFRPDLTAQRFQPDRFAGADARMYRTGDLGSLRDGVLFFHGRLDHQVKLRGHRIELGEIEAAALACTGVEAAVARVHAFAEGDSRLLLHVGAPSAAHDLAERLRQHLREQLPPYMIPQHVLVQAALPLLPNGKLDRQSLPLPQAADAPAQASTPAAARLGNEREQRMAALWSELIGVGDIRSGDNFFDIGGHSLLAVELVARVQRETGVRINLLDIAVGTLASLAMELPATQVKSASDASFGGRLRRLFGRR
jgi:acyl carrier protein